MFEKKQKIKILFINIIKNKKYDLEFYYLKLFFIIIKKI